ncbi:MAG: 6-carboxytetrahydropterin synthase [Actinobacteria bacterium]|nr:6-carboxytetrahydropterin synthase [Actinomycetota bacterium]
MPDRPDAMYETGTSVTVRALHRMPGMEGPEGRLHHHDYRLEVVAGRRGLDEAGMVVDLDALDAALGAVARRLHDADLECIRPPDAAAVTVEVFARWLHRELAPVAARAGAHDLAVRVWESPTAFGGYRAALT